MRDGARTTLVASLSIFLFLSARPIKTQEVPSTQDLAKASFTGELPLNESGLLTISKRVDEVNLLFTVTDEKGRFVNALQATDFNLLDNQKPPEKVGYFQQQSNLPLRVALLIDQSASISERFKFEQNAALKFLKKILRPGIDQAAVIGFDQSVHLMHDLTNDIPALDAAIHAMKTGGETSLYDAIVFASHKLETAKTEGMTRRAIIVISDGVDNRSKALRIDAQRSATRAEAPVFALSTNLVSGQDYPTGEAVLDLMARYTGGELLPGRENSQLVKAFMRIETALRSQYVLAYKPAGLESDGLYRTIDLSPKSAKVKVQCRKGYFAPKS